MKSWDSIREATERGEPLSKHVAGIAVAQAKAVYVATFVNLNAGSMSIFEVTKGEAWRAIHKLPARCRVGCLLNRSRELYLGLDPRTGKPVRTKEDR